MSLLVLGADGGGTKTMGLLSSTDAQILARRTVGASNPNVVGFDAAAKNLFDLISGCCSDAKVAPRDLSSIVLGLAGAGNEETRTKLREKIFTLANGNLPITIETDARIGLEGAFERGPGVIIIAGTGSIVFGKNKSGETHTVGGWGRAFGDEGSGFFLGLEVLKSLRLWYDGRGGSALLAESIAKEFRLDSRARIIHAVYQEKFELSKIAPFVLNAADQQDPVALNILRAGATELADQARALVERLAIGSKVGIVFLGGLIERENVYTNILKSKIENLIPAAEVRAPAGSPAEGALLMARAIVSRQ